MNIICLG